MDNINSIYSNLEARLRNINEMSKSTSIFSNTKGIVFIVSLVLLLISMCILPFPFSIISMLILAVTLLSYRSFHRNYNRQCQNTINEIISNNLPNIKNSITELEDLLQKQKQQIIELQKEKDSISAGYTKELEKRDRDLSYYNQCYLYLLRTAQTLDVVTSDFGEDCHKYIRSEMERVVKRCKLRFIDFNDESVDFYDVEYGTNIQQVSYAARAIISTEDNSMILEGHVFAPAK